MQTLAKTSAMLLQVLSVETALSIQSHPDKALAEKLHAQHPEVSTVPRHPLFVSYGDVQLHTEHHASTGTEDVLLLIC